jgi:hypothetical protein
MVLALVLLGSLAVAPAAGAKRNDGGPKGAKVEAPDTSGHDRRCAKLAEKVAELQAKRARVGARHGSAGVDGTPKTARRLAHIDDEIARAQAACI